MSDMDGWFRANVGSFALPDGGMVGVYNTGIYVAPSIPGGQIAGFTVLSATAKDMVLSADRKSIYVAIPEGNVIVEFYGFETE